MRQVSSAFSSRAVLAAAAAAVVFPTLASGQVLFSDNFDAGTSGANYDVYTANPTGSNGSANFAQNYNDLFYERDDGLGGTELVRVPTAPRSPAGAPKIGAVMYVNDALAAGQQNTVSAYPKAQNFSGNYKLTFDLWMNYNGGFEGGNASTEFMVAGINQGNVAGAAGPNFTATTGGTNTGNTFAMAGERGNGQDYRTYIDQTNQATRGFAAPAPSQQNGELNPYYADPATGLFPAPEFETFGSPGKRWVTVEMSQIAGVITWKINNNSLTKPATKVITSYADKTRTSGNITLGYGDFNTSSSTTETAAFQFALYDNVVVEAVDASLYWDTNATTAGAGGATPTGAWDGTASNFNTDAAGGAAGVVTPFTSNFEDVNFAAGADGTGDYTVNVTGTQAAKSVKVNRGNVTLAGGTIATGTFDVATGATGTVSSTVTGGPAGSLTKTGAGTLTLTAANAYTGGTNVQAGTLRVNRLHENNAVNITGGKLQVMDSSPTLPAHPSGDNAFVSRPSALAIANNGAALGARTYDGQLDLGNNDLIIDYDGTSPIAEIEDMVRAGYNGGNWLGNGIASSTANANANFALAVADNSRLTIQFNAGRPFSGQVVDSTTILVKFTHRIDLDLDGVITTNDATIFNSNYVEGAPAYWSIGDVDYDRVFTSNDATIFNGFYSEALASVPEPATLGVLGVAGLGLLRRRRQPSR